MQSTAATRSIEAEATVSMEHQSRVIIHNSPRMCGPPSAFIRLCRLLLWQTRHLSGHLTVENSILWELIHWLRRYNGKHRAKVGNTHGVFVSNRGRCFFRRLLDGDIIVTPRSNKRRNYLPRCFQVIEKNNGAKWGNTHGLSIFSVEGGD